MFLHPDMNSVDLLHFIVKWKHFYAMSWIMMAYCEDTWQSEGDIYFSLLLFFPHLLQTLSSLLRTCPCKGPWKTCRPMLPSPIGGQVLIPGSMIVQSSALSATDLTRPSLYLCCICCVFSLPGTSGQSNNLETERRGYCESALDTSDLHAQQVHSNPGVMEIKPRYLSRGFCCFPL